MTIRQKAIEEVKKGNYEEAWEMARKDEDLMPSVTREQWLKHACESIEYEKEVNAQMEKAWGGFVHA